MQSEQSRQRPLTYRQRVLGTGRGRDPSKGMTFRQRIEAICRREPVDRIVFQPRIESWIQVNRKRGILPAEYEDLPDPAIYGDLHCSFRPYHFFNLCLRKEYPCGIKEEEITEDRGKDGFRIIRRWTTPVGTIEKIWKRGEHSTHTDQFPVQSPEDFKVLEYLVREQQFSWDMELFDTLDFYLAADCTAPTMFLPRVNFMRLVVEWMGFERAAYALYDHAAEMRQLIRAMDESEERFLRVVADSPIELINYGDNIDCNIVSPPIFEEYILPQYERRAKILKPAGKFVHAHWDGSVKTLLPYARTCFLDGIEALTPVPQGDVTLEEIKEAVGEDMVLVDVLPMLSFMPNVSMEDFEKEVRRTIDMFAPNIILGVSDEISPDCEIEKVRRAAEIVDTY